jgi:hypothetical protein
VNDGRVWIAGKTAKLREGNAWTLTFATKVIEELKKPGVAHHQAMKNLRKHYEEWDKKGAGWLLFVRSPLDVQTSDTHLHCACAALAAERFRLLKGRWPDSLGELVKADLLKGIPLDLVDGKPLRFRKTNDGLVIYSISADGKGGIGNYRGDALDNLATFDHRNNRPEFRLWDVERRRVNR